MNLTVFIFLLFILQFFYWYVGRKASKNVNTQHGYFLADKNIRFFPLMMTFLASQVGGGLILGAAEEAYKFGWAIVFYPLGAACGLMVLGTRIGQKLAQFPVTTVAQILEVVYGSSFLRKIASSLSVATLFIMLVAQIIASSAFLASIGFNNTFLFIAFWAIVIFYTVRGGLKAVISTDIVQAAFFSIVFVGCFVFVLFSDTTATFLPPQVENFSFYSNKIYGWFLMPLFFIIIGQDVAQKCFAGSSPRVVQKASFGAGVCTLIVCIIPIFFGILAKTNGLIIPQGTSVLMAVIKKFTNPTVTALVGCAILAAIISTATSLISAISSNLSYDFNFSFLKEKKIVNMVQGLTTGISIIAILSAFFFDNIVDLLTQSFELSVSCLFVPIIFGLFRRQGNFLAAALSMLFGVIGFCLFRIYPIEFPKEVANIFVSLIGFYVGEMIYKFNLREDICKEF